ncbi:MAG: HD domain-containing protein [Candidatus Eisenbacteria sp.]|nr:HD domain-containing protein [Candidatus Eisenbacteria bacterium]
MTLPIHSAFSAFACTSCGDLLEELSSVLETSFAIFDSRGRPLCGRPTSAAPDAGGESGHNHRLVVPLTVHGKRLGTLVAQPGSKEMEPLVLTLAEQISERFRLESDLDRMTDQLSQSYDEINLLYDFAHLLRPERGFGENARALLRETADLLEHRLLIRFQADPQQIDWACGPAQSMERGKRWLTGSPPTLARIHSDAVARAATSGDRRPMRIPATHHAPQGVFHYVVVPVRTGEAITGYVGVFRTETENSFETTELRLLECLAEELSNASTTRQLNRELRAMLFNTVRSLVAAIDAKDEYTRGHSERVYHTSLAIGERLGLPETELRDLSWAALLHDIGKIAIRGDILNKPSRLTDGEFQAVRTHPERGCRVLEPIPQLRASWPGIRHHHERHDGKGYPDGLHGDEIPLLARIIAVADAYDAMISTRAYRHAQSSRTAREQINRGAGTQFDPRIVEVFLALEAEGVLQEMLPEASAHQAPAPAAAENDEQAA